MGWNVPDKVRVKVLKRLAAIVDPETEEGSKAKLRYVIQAAKTIASADLRQQQIDLDRQLAELRLGSSDGTLKDLVEEAEQLALELERQRIEEAGS